MHYLLGLGALAVLVGALAGKSGARIIIAVGLALPAAFALLIVGSVIIDMVRR